MIIFKTSHIPMCFFLRKKVKNIQILPWNSLQWMNWDFYLLFLCKFFAIDVMQLFDTRKICSMYIYFVQILSELWNEKIPAKSLEFLIFKLEINIIILVRKKMRGGGGMFFMFFFLKLHYAKSSQLLHLNN